MPDFDKIKLDPSSYYTSPRAVIDDSSFSREEKIEILHSWEYDLKQIMVAEEENMPTKSGNNETLDEVLEVLNELTEQDEPGGSAPDKTGGI